MGGGGHLFFGWFPLEVLNLQPKKTKITYIYKIYKNDYPWFSFIMKLLIGSRRVYNYFIHEKQGLYGIRQWIVNYFTS